MTQALTDKTYCLLLNGGVRLWLTEPEAQKIKTLLKDQNPTLLDIQDQLVRVSAIIGVLKASEIQTTDRIKRGDWMCQPEGEWHTRGQECGHNMR